MSDAPCMDWQSGMDRGGQKIRGLFGPGPLLNAP